MKLTISQEGSNPITIRTASEKTFRSEEKLGSYEKLRVLTRGIPTVLTTAGTTATGAVTGAAGGALIGGLGSKLAGGIGKHAITKAATKTIGQGLVKLGQHSAAKGIGGALLGGAAGTAIGFGAGLAASLGAESLIVTILNTIRSIGTFASGKEMLESNKLHDKLIPIRNKYKRYPTIAEIERTAKAKSKSGFLGWLFGGELSGKKVRDNIRTSNMIVKLVEDVPVAVTKLTPILGSADARQLLGQRVLVATAFVKTNITGGIKSISLCRGYLKRSANGDVNPTRECADIYWSEDGKAHGKKEILKYIKAIRSSESAGPIDVNEAMGIIDELSV